VRTVDGVQGLEFRTLIISTVRTCSVLGDNEEDAGFLSNPKVCHLYIVLHVVGHHIQALDRAPACILYLWRQS